MAGFDLDASVTSGVEKGAKTRKVHQASVFLLFLGGGGIRGGFQASSEGVVSLVLGWSSSWLTPQTGQVAAEL